ncbi:hypothetical protein MOK15_06585 [Sphingobium sp. BYY-5]|uniref:hypothetical protein n=1 Tax=Sphingobium sp. BYY-5 TaxID=2926400 RepID=UPI001FA7E5E4|nr:hypothetical protein [Sphingobium sp. BYY-5]MCI4589757.1 hypothetical protein [Sphingobium sp. BYY-5]
MRFALALMLLASPAALPAQIAPGSQPETAPGPIGVRIMPSTGADHELRESRERIREGRKSGTLKKSQARGLRREANQNDALAERYGRDGLSDSKRRELEMRGRALQSLTEAQRTQPRRP